MCLKKNALSNMAGPIETLFKEIDEKFNITQKQREAITILFDGENVLV